jgi:hypothetical protein
MPRVAGDGFLHVDEIDCFVRHDEPLLEYLPSVPDDVAARIGRYVARIVEDGDTIQVGYGSVPNAILAALGRKKYLGLHSELLTDGIVDLIRQRAIDNSRKSIDGGKSVASSRRPPAPPNARARTSAGNCVYGYRGFRLREKVRRLAVAGRAGTGVRDSGFRGCRFRLHERCPFS